MNDLERFDPKPTCVRYGVMGYICALAFILYIDRICIGQAGTSMKAELGLSNVQWSFVGVAFQIAYAIFEPTTGHWGDRFGSRRVLIRIVLWWSAFTALTGCVWRFSWEPLPGVVFSGFVLLLLIRFLFGAGEAGALPNAALVISNWFPPAKRGPALAMISTSAQLGGAVTPALAARFIDSPLIGWRWAFVIFGSLGVVWSWFFARWFRDDPATHPHVNDAERCYIQTGRSAVAESAAHVERVPWEFVLASANVWLLGAISACTSFFSYMLFFWFPTYLKEGRGLGEGPSGQLGSIPYLFGATGVLIGGYLGDWLTVRLGSRRRALGVMGTVGLLLAGTCVGGSVLIDAPLLAVLLCSVGYFFSYIQLAAWWSTMADIGGRHVGALFGLGNMIGLGGGALSQVFLGSYADYRKALGLMGRDQWDPAFYFYGGVLVVGGLLWLFINPAKPVVPVGESTGFSRKPR
ncbi:MAG TPA: MFS transporter [Pirellulales bacterium]|nr:MFS transporter [Pirellulales bacterium]